MAGKDWFAFAESDGRRFFSFSVNPTHFQSKPQALRRRLVELHELESDLSVENPSVDSSSGTTSPEEAASEGPDEPSTNGSSTNGSAAPTEPIPGAELPTIPHEEDDSDEAP